MIKFNDTWTASQKATDKVNKFEKKNTKDILTP